MSIFRDIRVQSGHGLKGVASFSLVMSLASVVGFAYAQDTTPTNAIEPAKTEAFLGTPAAPKEEVTSPRAMAVQAAATEASPAIEAAKFDLVDAAARYVALVKEAERMSLPNALASESIASSLVTTSRLSYKDITEGAGAYAALSVADDPAFSASLKTATTILGADIVRKKLDEDPAALIALLAGSPRAKRIASGALTASIAKIDRAQTILGEAAYSVQKERWAMTAVDTGATLAAHRLAATQPSGLTPFTSSDMPAIEGDTSVHDRFVIAATYRLLGDDVAATKILDKPLGRMCMNRVQLNIRQCLAASQYPYEHLFCLSRHSFGESLSCVKDAVK
jgi:hypothetical protein